MSDGTKNFCHVSLEQLKLLVDFMSQHPDFASGTLRSLEARHQNKQLWSELAKILNSRKGAKKTFEGWSRYWSDWKNKFKRKIAESKRRKLCSDKKETCIIKPLTKIEKQALAILEPIFYKKKPLEPCDPLPLENRTVMNDPIQKKILGHNDPCDPLPTEIKQESLIETVMLTNNHCKAIGVESEQSTQSSEEEFIEDEDHSPNEILLKDIYPKWLMEIEKKRADAELRRAKTEEQRTESVAKIAEAMLIQAEAMKKQSEAAKIQADAMLRIAMVIENRSDDLSLLQARHLPGYH